MVTGELKWHIKDSTLQTTKVLKLTEEKEKNVKALESNQQILGISK